MEKSYTCRYRIDDALNWELYKQTLRWELTDRTEKEAASVAGEHIYDCDGEVTIAVEGEEFVATLTWVEPEVE